MFSRLLALFIFVPLVELAIFLWIGDQVGLLNTIAIIFLTGALGAYLTKSQGLRVLRDFQQSTASGKMPHEALVEGLIILVAGALLLTPGFLTDIVGFLALIPITRQQLSKLLIHKLKDRITIVTPNQTTSPRPSRVDDDVIDV